MKFTYNPRIIRHLGYELITSDAIAITELIKNSYDAKSTKVVVQFSSSVDNINIKQLTQPIPNAIHKKITELSPNGIIILEDNGKGMDYNTLKEGFFEVGSVLKKEEKEVQDENSDEIILGDKGIGRLAAQRIAPALIVETSIEGSAEVNIVYVNWQDFITNVNFDAPEWKEDRTEGDSYTRLWLVGVNNINNYYEEREDFEPDDLFGNRGKSLGKSLYVKDELHSALSFLYSPFEEKKSVIDLNLCAEDRKINIDFNYEALKVAETKHVFNTKLILDDLGDPKDLVFDLKMEIKPWFIQRIHQSILGDVLYRSYKKPAVDYQKLYNKYRDYYIKNLQDSFLLSEAYKRWNKKSKDSLPEDFINAILKISPIEGEIYSFKRDQALMSMARTSAIANNYIGTDTRVNYNIRPFLEANNGIKLYRNSFRIASIGNRDNDWLELQQRRTSGQQFYRFELGNVIGYIKVNDKKQDYIYETSSREHLTENIYASSLQRTLTEVFEIFSPNFNKRAIELTKKILDDEGWIPENSEAQLQKEVDKSKEILEAAKRNMFAIRSAITLIKDNIDLDSQEKINSVKKIFNQLEPATLDFEKNIEDTENSFKSANLLLEITKQEQGRIKTEAYNNYKLMANGLVTEIITHELHSMLSNSDEEARRYDEHMKMVEEYFLDNELYDLNRNHFLPIKNKFEHLYKRMGDLSRFYSFLEKTFITNEGNRALVPTEIKKELETIGDRFKFRLTRHKVDINYSSVDNVWEVPTGAMLHVFYNLIDNSLYWIRERQKLSRNNVMYTREEKDEIVIRSTSQNTIEFYDTGTGIIDKYQDILFNELVSGKENGRGMGLYIVRQFLKSFGGNIELLPTLNEYGNRYVFEISINNSLENE